MEEIKKQAFAHEKNFERKIIICRSEEFKKMNSEQKKAEVMLIRFLNGREGRIITFRVVSPRFFVSKYMYWGRELSYLHRLKFIKEVSPRTELG